MSEESVRKVVMAGGCSWLPTPSGAPTAVEIGSAEALRLLGGVSLGRVVFTWHALPAIRPVNHVLDNGDVVFRTHQGAAIAALAVPSGDSGDPGVVVAYEADDIDPVTHLGWSVSVTGYAELVTDPAELARYQHLLHPWVDQVMDHAVRVHPDLVTGIRLTPRVGPADG